jgi:hypothetical protein
MTKENTMRIIQALNEKRYSLEKEGRKEEAEKYLQTSETVREIYEI